MKRGIMNRSFWILIFVTFLFHIPGNSFSEEPSKDAPAFRFALYLAEEGHPDKFAIQDPDEYRLSSRPFITDKDIKSYDWNNQELVLTEETSGKMLRKYGERPIVEIMKVFVLTVDGKRIYAGRMTYPETAMFLKYPVILPKNNNGVFILRIRPSTAYAFGGYPGPKDKRERHEKAFALIEDPRIKEVFRELGKLKEDSK